VANYVEFTATAHLDSQEDFDALKAQVISSGWSVDEEDAVNLVLSISKTENLPG